MYFSSPVCGVDLDLLCTSVDLDPETSVQYRGQHVEIEQELILNGGTAKTLIPHTKIKK